MFFIDTRHQVTSKSGSQHSPHNRKARMEELRDHVHIKNTGRSENTRSEDLFKCKSFCVGARKFDGGAHDLEPPQKVAVNTSASQKLYEFSINIVLEVYFAR